MSYRWCFLSDDIRKYQEEYSNFINSKDKLRQMAEDSVAKVFCYIKESDYDDISSCCLESQSPTTISVKCPINFKTSTPKETTYMFKHVFAETATQKEVFDVVGLPLVDGLIQGKNGLLFACGNTNEREMIQKCLAVIFKTIGLYQARKYVFKQDKLNGFEIQSEIEALIDCQEDICEDIVTGKATKTPQKVNGKESSDQFSDVSPLTCVREDHLYAVFVSCVEIYNKSVFDLLEDVDATLYRRPQSRVIREDASHNMYVHLATEVEVKSADETLKVFQKGQRRKRKVHATLNMDSSRSHTVFNIRLVQCPVHNVGEEPVPHNNGLHVSQLSFVDLAGFDRPSRTKNGGQRVQQSGNINNSLLTLRTCLEVLRENQTSGTSPKKKVPFRDSKLTLLFKNYFEGDGQVHILVCVSPLSTHYEETVQVLKFFDMTQEVQVTHPPATPHTNNKLTAGRKVANQVSREALKQLDTNNNMNVTYSSLSPSFPDLELDCPQNCILLTNLIQFLQLREARRKKLHNQLAEIQSEFRENLLEVEKSNIFITQENSTLNLDLQSERERNVSLENKLMELENAEATLKRAMCDKDKCLRSLDQQIREKNVQLRNINLEKTQIEQHYNDKFLTEKERLDREMRMKLRENKIIMKNKKRQSDIKIQKMKDILLADTPHEFQSAMPSATDTDTDDCLPPQTTAPSSVKIPGNGEPDMSHPQHTSTPRSSAHVPDDLNESNHNVVPSQILKQFKGGVFTLRQRRSRSVAKDLWIEHRPGIPTKLDTVLQPHMKRKKLISKLNNAKDVMDPKVSKYCLVTQKLDSEGEVETNVYKADVNSTTCGGAEVVFNEVETLILSPPTSPRGKT